MPDAALKQVSTCQPYHAECRQLERDITLLDAFYVIKNGYREPKHDNFKEEFQAWNYAVRGITLQNDAVRVIISFEENGKLLIITVINTVRREE